MSISLKNRFLAVAILSIFALVSCKSSDNTIVIEDAPVSSGPSDTTIQESMDDRFQQLTMGEVMPIRSLDPLFVQNTAGMRTVQLLYEGLVRYDENGEIVPAVAKDWTVSSGSLTYRFNLKSDIFYHDSNVFSNGIGRKLTARDVKYVFERMAKADVPSRAAQFFMNIRGFEPYYQEERQILQPEDRQLESISGIQVPNDSTITFSLVEPDPNFINKLATPYAVIYPKETVTSNGFKAVGSGPFKLSQKRSDSLYIFSKFENYRIEDQPILNRVDIRTSSHQEAILKALASGQIDLLPQLGPDQIIQTLNANGTLNATWNNGYRLNTISKTLMYTLLYNQEADMDRNEVYRLLNHINPDSLFSDLPDDAIYFNWSVPASQKASAADSVSTRYSADVFIKALYQSFDRQLADNNIAFNMSKSRVLNRDVELYMQNVIPLFPKQKLDEESEQVLARMIVSVYSLSQKNISTLNFNGFPWWIDLRETTVAMNKNR